MVCSLSTAWIQLRDEFLASKKSATQTQ
jgi:hypothetical protein